MSTVQTNNKVSDDLLTSMNGGKKSAASIAQEAQDRFMTLLVTQMRNQDPLNPLDNAQVTSQLAQLSTVTGIDKLNTTLQALQSSYQTSQSLQAASMIGHGVLVPGNQIRLSEGKSIFGVEMNEAADNVQVIVRNSAGVEVHKLSLGAQETGIVPAAWDGKTSGGTQLPDGVYTFEVVATRGDAKAAATALSFGEVVSVTTSGQGVKLNMPGLNSVGMTDVRQIL